MEIACKTAPAARPLSLVFREILQSFDGKERILFSDIVGAMRARSFGLLMLIFALPMALPLPVPPGINIMLASPLVLLTAQQALGFIYPWFPAKWLSKDISLESLRSILHPAIGGLEFLERFVKPRFRFLTRGLIRRGVGVWGFILTLYICIPAPLTNTVPSMAIVLMSLGLLMRDGLAVIFGALLGLIWVGMLTSAIILWGPDGINIIKEFLQSLIHLGA